MTGTRREDLAGLNWLEVDHQWNSISIKAKIEGKRTIPLMPFVASLLPFRYMVCAVHLAHSQNGLNVRPECPRKSWATNPVRLLKNTIAVALLTCCACGIAA